MRIMHIDVCVCVGVCALIFFPAWHYHEIFVPFLEDCFSITFAGHVLTRMPEGGGELCNFLLKKAEEHILCDCVLVQHPVIG